MLVRQLSITKYLSNVIFQEVLTIKMVLFAMKKKKIFTELLYITLFLNEKILNFSPEIFFSWPLMPQITEISKYFSYFFTSMH